MANVPAYDHFHTIPEFAALSTSVRGHSWAPVEIELERMSADLAGFAIASLAEVDGVESFLESALAAHPRSPFARTAMAARYIVIAWSVRTSNVASEVSSQEFARFFEWLARAEQLLLEVCAETPDFAPAWAMRVLSARGLELGKSEAWRRHRKLDSLSPHNFPTQSHMLQYLLPKWFGTMDEAAAFARESTASAPLGSSVGALIAQYHVEQWLAVGAQKPGLAYLQQPQVLAELRDAAARSVLNPAHRLDPIGVVAHNTFLMVFWLGGHNSDAAAHARVLEGRASEFPWSYTLNNPALLEQVYRNVLEQKGKKR